MSSFDRRTLILLPLALAACGFAPVLAPGGAAAELWGRVRAADPKSRNDLDFLARIEARLGPPQQALYELGYRIETTTKGVGVTPEGATPRYNLLGSVDWSLTRAADGAALSGGREEAFTAYSATGSTVAGAAAQADAANRLMVILADRVVARLLAGAGAWAP